MSKRKESQINEEVKQEVKSEEKKETKEVKVELETSGEVVVYVGGSNLLTCFSDYPDWFKLWIDDLNKNAKISYVDIMTGSGTETHIAIENHEYKQRLSVGTIIMLVNGKVEIGERALLEFFKKGVK